MLTARKNRLLNRLIYHALIASGLRLSFHCVWLRQVTPAPVSDPRPVVLFGNHSAWWDAHLAMALNERCWHKDGYVMVEHTQLSRYQFFRACGAFSVDRTNPRSAMRSITYATELLCGAPHRLLLIFPQGEILANDVRPLRFQNGTAHIARRVAQRTGACLLYPMALRYEFIGEQKPDAFISIGPPIRVLADDLPAANVLNACLEAALTETLDALRNDVVAYRFADFQPLMWGLGSINRWWDALRGKTQIKRVGWE